MIKKNIKPGIVQPEAGRIPGPVKSVLDNGINMYIFESGTEDLMRIDFTFPAGQLYENMPLISSLTNAMLSEGTSAYTSHKLNSLIDYYGAFCNTYCEKDQAGIMMHLINRHYRKVLPLIAEMIASPAFRQQELSTLVKKRIRWLMVNRKKTGFISSELFFRSVYGSSHPYGTIPEINDYKKIKREMLVSYHSENYDPGNMTIIVAGKIPPDFITVMNSLFGRFQGRKKTDIVKSLPVPVPGHRKNLSENIESAVQSSIKIGSPAITTIHPDFLSLKITDTVLGGYFGSRLMKNIREDKGYTYGIGSSVNSLKAGGYKVIYADVDKRKKSEAVQEVISEIRIMQRECVGKEELEIVRSYLLGEIIRTFDGPFAVADAFRSAWEAGLDNSYYDSMINKVKTIQPDEIKHIAETYYNIDDLFFISAG